MSDALRTAAEALVDRLRKGYWGAETEALVDALAAALAAPSPRPAGEESPVAHYAREERIDEYRRALIDMLSDTRDSGRTRRFAEAGAAMRAAWKAEVRAAAVRGISAASEAQDQEIDRLTAELDRLRAPSPRDERPARGFSEGLRAAAVEVQRQSEVVMGNERYVLARAASVLAAMADTAAPPARDERAEADAADIALTEAGADLAATIAFAAAVQCVADYKDEIAQRHLYPGRTEQLTALHEAMERLRALAEFAAAPESVEAPPAPQHNDAAKER